MASGHPLHIADYRWSPHTQQWLPLITPQTQYWLNLVIPKIVVIASGHLSNSNIYICKCFSLYGINNEIDVQFCINTFDHVIIFNLYEYKFLVST